MSEVIPIPCKPECTERNSFCHSTCEKYAEFVRLNNERQAKKQRDFELDDAIYAARRRSLRARGKLKDCQGGQP